MLASQQRMSRRRVMAKAKVYGFSPWVDQVDSINQIMKDTGERNESALLRKLVDEALSARRKKSQSAEVIEKSDDAGLRLETIEILLMRLVGQGDISFRILDVCLVLLQDALAEAHATRRLSWQFLVVPQLREQGLDANELESRFALQADQAKNYAINLAERIMQSQQSEK